MTETPEMHVTARPWQLLEFHATIHPRPAGIAARRDVELHGRLVASLEVTSQQLYAGFPRTFEQVGAELEMLPRMLLEPDGSFVWSGEFDKRRWQLDGHLYDRHQRLLYLEAKGTCPNPALDELLPALGWPQNQVMFQLVRQAVALDEPAFRQVARSNA